jgi:AraC-like DNA-binding protein
MAEGSAAASVVRRMMELAVTRGADRRALAERAAIDPAVLEDHDERVPLERYKAVIRAGQQLAGDPALALHYAEAVNLSEVSVVGLLGYASETMADAFVQLQRFSKLVVEVDTGMAENRFEMAVDARGLWLVDNRSNPNDFHELTETAFGQMVTGTRRFGDTPFVLEVEVTHDDPGYRAEYERILGAPVRFGAERNAMRIDPAWPEHRVAVQPRYVFGILNQHAEAMLRRLESEKTARGRVESLLMPILHKGEVGIDSIAAKLGCSRQTLFRRLKAEDSTFEKVLDELRHKLAVQYLAGGKVSVNETAYLVGFSDPAAFSRAFKRWTGFSPREARGARVVEAEGNER